MDRESKDYRFESKWTIQSICKFYNQTHFYLSDSLIHLS